VPALAALSDDEPLVRSHAAWALGRLRSPAAATALRERWGVEPDAAVRAAATLDALAAAANWPPAPSSKRRRASGALLI